MNYNLSNTGLHLSRGFLLANTNANLLKAWLDNYPVQVNILNATPHLRYSISPCSTISDFERIYNDNKVAGIVVLSSHLQIFPKHFFRYSYKNGRVDILNHYIGSFVSEHGLGNFSALEPFPSSDIAILDEIWSCVKCLLSGLIPTSTLAAKHVLDIQKLNSLALGEHSVNDHTVPSNFDEVLGNKAVAKISQKYPFLWDWVIKKDTFQKIEKEVKVGDEKLKSILKPQAWSQNIYEQSLQGLDAAWIWANSTGNSSI